MHQPGDMAPPKALRRVVRIGSAIGVQMMESMETNPSEYAALTCQRATEDKEVLDGFRNLEATVAG